jgi:tetratricopeptide (TPR) repeat protein
MRFAGVMLLLAVVAHAEDDSNSRARAHFEIGNGMYRLGDYRGALREFAAGYELTRKPGFLINLGQTYRKLKDLPRAREMYRQFLSVTPQDDPARGAVKQVLDDIERELRDQPPSPTEPVPPLPSPAPPPPQASTPPSITQPPPPPPPKRRGVQIAGIVVGVLGIGMIGGGAGATVAANNVATELNNLDRNGGTFDPAKDDLYKLDRALAGTFFGLGAAFAVTGIVLIAVGSR